MFRINRSPQLLTEIFLYFHTDVLFVNGNIDPWSALSITESLDATLPAIFINGTAHCADMLEPNPKSPKALLDAQNKISQQIGKWLAQVPKKPKYSNILRHRV